MRKSLEWNADVLMIFISGILSVSRAQSYLGSKVKETCLLRFVFLMCVKCLWRMLERNSSSFVSFYFCDSSSAGLRHLCCPCVQSVWSVEYNYVISEEQKRLYNTPFRLCFTFPEICLICVTKIYETYIFFVFCSVL